jgi:hypothetical protein
MLLLSSAKTTRLYADDALPAVQGDGQVELLSHDENERAVGVGQRRRPRGRGAHTNEKSEAALSLCD